MSENWVNLNVWHGPFEVISSLYNLQKTEQILYTGNKQARLIMLMRDGHGLQQVYDISISCNACASASV